MTQPMEVKTPEWSLGWRLLRSFAHAGLTTEQIADEIGVSRSTVSRWVNERGAGPKRGYLMAIALRCGVPFRWLAEGTSNQHLARYALGLAA